MEGTRENKRLTLNSLYFLLQMEDRLIFTNWWLGFTSMEPRTGKKLWELSVFGRPHSERAIYPYCCGDLVLGVCGFTTLDKHLVAIRPTSVSKWKSRRVWRLEDTMLYIPSPLVSGNRLYLWADNGVITCVRPHNKNWYGKLGLKVSAILFGSPVRAGNKIFAYQHTGKWW